MAKSKRGKQMMAEAPHAAPAPRAGDALFEMLLDAGKEMAPKRPAAPEAYAAAHPERPECHAVATVHPL